jgi:ribosomal-protein-alanine N-acetyltransferase
MRIGVCGPAFAPLLAQLHASSFDAPWSEESLANLLASPGVLALLAQDDGKPLGFILCRLAACEAEILTFAVPPALRRQGTGLALMQQAILELAQAGAERLFLEVGESNEAAISLYKKNGLSEVARRRNYYGPGQDALLLSRPLEKNRDSLLHKPNSL